MELSLDEYVEYRFNNELLKMNMYESTPRQTNHTERSLLLTIGCFLPIHLVGDSKE